eukprot:m.264495 g.264495  ORF g.264495 m.264495 type:complete len:114 (-) comp28223_c0_seq1:10-351(-)
MACLCGYTRQRYRRPTLFIWNNSQLDCAYQMTINNGIISAGFVYKGERCDVEFGLSHHSKKNMQLIVTAVDASNGRTWEWQRLIPWNTSHNAVIEITDEKLGCTRQTCPTCGK